MYLDLSTKIIKQYLCRFVVLLQHPISFLVRFCLKTVEAEVVVVDDVSQLLANRCRLINHFIFAYISICIRLAVIQVENECQEDM